MNPALSAPRLAPLGLLLALLAAAVCARASDLSFSAGLSGPDRSDSGIAHLKPAQVAALDLQVGRDVTLAHEGGVTGFSQGFLARRTPADRAAAGLDSLTAPEGRALDRLVSRAIALGPPPTEGFRYVPRPAPPPAPAVRESDVTLSAKTEIHGDVSVTVGGGSHGQSFYGTSADAYLVDPKHGFTIGVGFSEFRGKGLLDLCGPYGPYAPEYAGPPYLPNW